MKQRTIPDYRKPLWEATLNGKRYVYPAGTTQMVPDGVAELIDQINAAMHPAAQDDYVPSIPGVTTEDEGKVLKVSGRKYVLAEDSDKELPVVTSTDNGKVLKVNGGKWEKGTDNDTKYDPLQLNATMTSETTMTTTVTAAELYAAISAGRMIHAIIGSTQEMVVSFLAGKTGTGDDATYDFGFLAGAGVWFHTDDLAANDTVVFTIAGA